MYLPPNESLLINANVVNLKELRDFMEAKSGEWNGDESGKLEDMASIAQEIIDTTNTLQGLLEEWETNDY